MHSVRVSQLLNVDDVMVIDRLGMLMVFHSLAGCEGDHVDIAKNNGNVLGPGAVNLVSLRC